MRLTLGLLLVFLGCFATFAAEKQGACLLPHSVSGNGVIECEAYFPSWSYNSKENECVKFIYGGCFGNDNRFPSKVECEEACKK